MDIPLHPFNPKDWVLLKILKNKHPHNELEPSWGEPYERLLITHSVKLGVKP